MPSGVTKCRSCPALVFFALTVAGRRQLLDAAPDPQGIVLAYQDAGGRWHSKAWVAGVPVLPPWKRFTDHHATCPAAAEYRKTARPERD